MIEGRIEYGSYEKDGVKHYTTDIVAENMTMLGSPGGRGQDREPEPPFGPPQAARRTMISPFKAPPPLPLPLNPHGQRR